MTDVSLRYGAVAVVASLLVAGALGSAEARPPGEACAATWSLVPGTRAGWPSDVVVTGDDDVWVVGTRDESHGWKPFVERWDGTQWREVQLPQGVTRLSAPAARRRGEPWVVMTTRTGTYVYRWRGSSWEHLMRAPGRLVHALEVRATNDVWAVSDSRIVRWRGRSWTRMKGVSAGATALAVRSATDAWAVGTAGSASTLKGRALHYDGRQWRAVPVPDPPDAVVRGGNDPGGEALYSVDVAADGSAWAAGERRGFGNFVLRWDHRSWRRVPVPSVTVSWATVIGPGNAWLIGDWKQFLHWDGRRFSAVRTPLRQGSEGMRIVAVSRQHSRDRWTVRQWFSGWADSPVSPLVSWGALRLRCD